jgi:hypothetical protein
MDTRIIVGVSPGLAGLSALRYAVTQARARNAELLAVRTWLRPTDPGLLAAEQTDCHHAQAIAEIDEAFTLAMGTKPTDFPVHVMACAGDAASVILLLVTGDQDLVVLGAGEHRWRRSRTVLRCVRRAGCPVVVVPAPMMGSTASPRRLVRDLRRLLSAPLPDHPVR